MIATPSDPQSRSAVAEFGRCLAIDLGGTERDALRVRLNNGGWEAALQAAVENNLLPALAESVLAKHLALGIPAVAIGGRATVSLELAEASSRHLSRRTAMLGPLIELVRLLNVAGIEPILLKGARSLWTGEPAWRSMRDLDLLVPGRAADAQAIALGAGYVPIPEADIPPDWHHQPNLYRADLPGWLEFHDRGAMHRADVLLPTRVLAEASALVPVDGAAARVLPVPHDLLYCMLHHHIGHRGDKFGTMSLKGLYEFATALSSLSPDERTELLRLAARHPRLLAILDLWIAAAADWLNMPVSAPPFSIAHDAARRWEGMKAQGGGGGNYAGVLGEFLMAAATARLRRLPRGRTWLGRQRLRMDVLASLLAPATRHDEGGPPQR